MFNFLYFAFMMLFPFYLFSSGQPQISHMILIVIFGAVFILMFSRFIQAVKENIMFMIFLIYIIYVNTSWLIITGSVSFVVYTLFYIFNILLFYSTYLLYKEHFMTSENIRNSIFWSLILQFIFLLASGLTFNTRNMLFFNNPNQLGYFSISVINIYFILGVNQIKPRDSLEILKNITVYSIAFLLLVFSSSKSALVSYAMFLIFIFYIEMVKRFNTKKLLVALLLGLVVIGTMTMNLNKIEKVAENTELFSRTVNAGTEEDDSLAGRGYDRIIQYVQYTLLGAGEGKFTRFPLSKHHGELHSTIANILFSYGFIGLLLFISLFLNPKYHIGRVLFYMSPILLYGLAHNGIRSPLFWIAFALSLIYSQKEKNI
ncbi:MAG: O-antigen ligase family protein [Sulfurovaceae bacterium]|nr:O-antigen ligase family protein [Sulfurovaceae bacterium]